MLEARARTFGFAGAAGFYAAPAPHFGLDDVDAAEEAMDVSAGDGDEGKGEGEAAASASATTASGEICAVCGIRHALSAAIPKQCGPCGQVKEG